MEIARADERRGEDDEDKVVRDGCAGGGVRLAHVRQYAYLTSVVNVEDSEGEYGAFGGDGSLSMIVERLGMDASAVRLMERALTSGSARTRDGSSESSAVKLLPEVSLYDFEGYLRRTREWYGSFVEYRAYAESARAEAGARSEARLARYDLTANVKDIATVPGLFFDENFELERRDVFASACLGLEDHSLRNLSAASTSLQDDLSEHLDTIEQHLIREISGKSDEFFTVLASLHKLHESMTSMQHIVSALRGRVAELGSRLLKPGKQMINLHAKRDNLRALADTFESISALAQMRADMDVLVESTDYPGALTIAEDIQQMLRKDDMIRDLACFRKLPEHVAQTIEKVREAMLRDFIAGANLSRDIKTLVSKETLYHLVETGKACGLDVAGSTTTTTSAPSSTTIVSAPIDPRGNVIETTFPPLLALLYSGSNFLCEALERWSSELVESVRDIERVAVDVMLAKVTGERRHPSTSSLEEGSFDSAYANSIRKLPPQVFAEILQALSKTFGIYFDRMSQIRLIVKGIVVGDEDALTSIKEMDEGLVSVAREAAIGFEHAACQRALAITNDAVQKVTDVAQGRFAKLLGVRAPMNVTLAAKDFMRIIDVAVEFLGVAEALGKHRCLSLRTTLANQIKAFIREQHTSVSAKLATALESETWVAVNAPKRFQRLVDRLITGDVKVSNEEGDVDDEVSSVAVVVGDGRYRTVKSAMMMIQLLADDLLLAKQLPTFATEVTHCVIDLLKQYNTSVCQLILGAGAMQVSKLKSITAKHLALAQQSISLVAAVIADLKTPTCELVDGPKRFLLEQEFDRSLRDLKLHKSEIHEKLVSIMRDRVEFHLHNLSSIIETLNVEEQHDAVVTSPTEFSTALTKEMGTLRRVISELLSEDDQRDILGRVGAESASMIVAKLAELMSSIEANLFTLTRITADIESILQAMKSFPISEAHVVPLKALFDALSSAAPPPQTSSVDRPDSVAASNDEEETA
jgi:vacuolar protein sorting-associated protein 54